MSGALLLRCHHRAGRRNRAAEPAAGQQERHARYPRLTEEVTALQTTIDQLTRLAAPELRAQFGVGGDVAAALMITAGDNPERLVAEASFAAPCGASPIPASSGKTSRFRLNRGGDRQANAALHAICLFRVQRDTRNPGLRRPTN